MINRDDNQAGSDSYTAPPSTGRGEPNLQVNSASTHAAPELDAKGLLLRDALAILTVVGALVAFYGMIKLVSYLSGIPFP
jgi:hypothetical protein